MGSYYPETYIFKQLLSNWCQALIDCNSATCRFQDICHNLGPKFRAMGPWGTAPKRQEDLSGTDMYHCAKFHADWWHHCIDIETYKIQHGKEHIDHRQLFKLVSNGHELRGHDLKLYKQYNRLNIRKHFFSQRVIDAWNQLPPSVVDAASINSFKRNLEDFLKDMGTKS